jgi:tripartite ATP-independent transporter DctM subunit
MEITLGILLLLVLIAVGWPVGFAIGIAGTISLLMSVGPNIAFGLMSQVVHHATANYVILTIPTFILMAELLSASGIAEDLMVAFNRRFSRLRGGLATACIAAGAVFAAACGSSTAAVASLSRSAYPTMKKLGYDQGFSVAIISITGTLSILIPPSIALVVYGIITEESVGKLFLAGVFPGILTALGYIATVYVMIWLRPGLVPPVPKSILNQPVDSLVSEPKGRVWPIGLLILLVLGSLYTGVATPTEVGALGAVGAFLICLGMRRLSFGGFKIATGNTLKNTAMIVTIIFGALIFGQFITMSQVIPTLLQWISDGGYSPLLVLFFVVLFYILLGMFMDQFAILLLTVPITYGLLTGLGFDGIWVGILIVKTAEIGLITPPMGLNVFIASGATGVNTKEVFARSLPFVITEILLIVLFVAFPELVMWLPNNM